MAKNHANLTHCVGEIRLGIQPTSKRVQHTAVIHSCVIVSFSSHSINYESLSIWHTFTNGKIRSKYLPESLSFFTTANH
jgi:hypothetical protein